MFHGNGTNCCAKWMDNNRYFGCLISEFHIVTHSAREAVMSTEKIKRHCPYINCTQNKIIEIIQRTVGALTARCGKLKIRTGSTGDIGPVHLHMIMKFILRNTYVGAIQKTNMNFVRWSVLSCYAYAMLLFGKHAVGNNHPICKSKVNTSFKWDFTLMGKFSTILWS